MAFEFKKDFLSGPAIWLALAMTLTMASCWLYADGREYRGIAAFICALACATRVLKTTSRLRERVRYLINAALHGDFSYKFPTDGVPKDERETNISLNRIVSHLETLAADARQNEEFLNLVIDLVDTGIIVANDRGHVIHANKAALTLLSLPALTDIRQLPADTPGLSVTQIPATLRGSRHTIHTITDIRRPMQTAEVESWEKLTRVLTHEIMNSLTPIHSITDTLSREHDDELRQQLQVVSSSCRALMEFVRNFRRFTVIPAPQPKLFYIKPLVERVTALVASSAPAPAVDFRVMVFPPDAMLHSDEAMLNQVLVNLLKNAVEARPTLIEVTAKVRDDEDVEIAVANNGDTISDELAGQIFTPFFTTKPSGSGIGLSLCRRIVTALGGTLTLSTRPTTRFSIII